MPFRSDFPQDLSLTTGNALFSRQCASLRSVVAGFPQDLSIIPPGPVVTPPGPVLKCDRALKWLREISGILNPFLNPPFSPQSPTGVSKKCLHQFGF